MRRRLLALLAITTSSLALIVTACLGDDPERVTNPGGVDGGGGGTSSGGPDGSSSSGNPSNEGGVGAIEIKNGDFESSIKVGCDGWGSDGTAAPEVVSVSRGSGMQSCKVCRTVGEPGEFYINQRINLAIQPGQQYTARAFVRSASVFGGADAGPAFPTPESVDLQLATETNQVDRLDAIGSPIPASPVPSDWKQIDVALTVDKPNASTLVVQISGSPPAAAADGGAADCFLVDEVTLSRVK